MKPTMDYRTAIALTDFMQRVRVYYPVYRTFSKERVTDWLEAQATIEDCIEWRGVSAELIRAVAKAVADQAFLSVLPMVTLLGRYVKLVGGRVSDNDEARYSFLPMFDRNGPAFIGKRLYPDFYK